MGFSSIPRRIWIFSLKYVYWEKCTGQPQRRFSEGAARSYQRRVSIGLDAIRLYRLDTCEQSPIISGVSVARFIDWLIPSTKVNVPTKITVKSYILAEKWVLGNHWNTILTLPWLVFEILLPTTNHIKPSRIAAAQGKLFYKTKFHISFWTKKVFKVNFMKSLRKWKWTHSRPRVERI